MTGTIPDALQGLLESRAYQHATGAITLVETHISWILLAGEFAYKIKRPVRLAFLDQRSLERRRFLCLEELRLNRRFAPAVYLDVVSITLQDGSARIGGLGSAAEYAVRMHRFDRSQELDRLLASEEVVPAELARFGTHLAELQAGLPRVHLEDPWGRATAVRALILENFDQLLLTAATFGTAGEIEALRLPLSQKLTALGPALDRRRETGRVREGHGDLHSRNIARIAGELVAFDCIEFEPSFRWIDVVDETALLLVDLETRGWPQQAHAFWSAYLEQSGDYDGHRILDLYKAHRALVRAKVAALTTAASTASEEHRALLNEHRALLRGAHQALKPRQTLLLLVGGVSGSGKTWVAQHLAPALQMIHVRSDLERKRLGGLAPTAGSNSGLGQGLYSPAMTEAVYARLCECAEAILAGGYSALIDATFSNQLERRRFADLAARLGVRVGMIRCRAEFATLRARLAARQQAGRDASEADDAVLDWQLRQFEPVTADERIEVFDLDTDRSDVIAVAQAAIRDWFGG